MKEPHLASKYFFIKKLILVRHAHRNTNFGREKDNGLSSKGKINAMNLLKTLRLSSHKGRVVLYSSPKKRCVETLIPLSRQLNQSIKMDLNLLEKGTDESARHFKKRIALFYYGWLKNGSQITVACSHGDFIPLFLKLVTNKDAHLKKGDFVSVNLRPVLNK